mmetsp:Transcript_31155/g.77196  ORF Transcript_31155/g.77196 Transcript_31155/m.77196 type:complete len:255 (-) Transcript_31155:195-959(-)
MWLSGGGNHCMGICETTTNHQRTESMTQGGGEGGGRGSAAAALLPFVLFLVFVFVLVLVFIFFLLLGHILEFGLVIDEFEELSLLGGLVAAVPQVERQLVVLGACAEGRVGEPPVGVLPHLVVVGAFAEEEDGLVALAGRVGRVEALLALNILQRPTLVAPLKPLRFAFFVTGGVSESVSAERGVPLVEDVLAGDEALVGAGLLDEERVHRQHTAIHKHVVELLDIPAEWFAVEPLLDSLPFGGVAHAVLELAT